jgi:hypothetical protein
MPREIIDTASSRPAYIRRRIITAVLYVVLIVAVVAAGYVYWEHHRAPGNSARQGNLAPVPVSRRVHAS